MSLRLGLAMHMGHRASAVPAPTLTSVSPTIGTSAGGTPITLTGTNLTGATSIAVGGLAATSLVVVNATTVTAVTPVGMTPMSNADVRIATPGGTSNTLTGAFTVLRAGYVMHVRGDLGIHLNSGNVSQWDDQSGNNNHWLQATAGSQPLYVASSTAFNSQSTVRIQKANSNYMYVTDAASMRPTTFTFMAVVKLATATNFGTVFGRVSNSSWADDWAIGNTDGAGTQLATFVNSYTTAAASFGTVGNNAVQLVGSYDPTLGSANISSSLNGAAPTTVNYTTAINYIANINYITGAYWNSAGTSPVSFTDVEWAEAILWPSDLISADRIFLHSYAQSRYGTP